MDERALNHLISRVQDIEIREDPYPHFFIDKIFPEDFYQQLLESIPDSAHYDNISETGRVTKGKYKERSILSLHEQDLQRLPPHLFSFWNQFASAIHSREWISALLMKFEPYIRERFGWMYEMIEFSSIAELITDRTNYSIGPHTDLPMRVLTLLFYFPKTDEQQALGTSVYSPKDPLFTCEGLQHHTFDPFTKKYTAPFLPNSLFGFVKSDRSFHGVEPIETKDVNRNLMNYILTWKLK